MKLVNKINKKTLLLICSLIVCLQPLFDLDYLIYDYLDKFNIPRFSTILRFIIIPLIILLVFISDKQKKSTLIVGGIYGLCLGIYFILHCQNAIEVFPKLYMPSNYYFSIFQELVYVLTLVLPFGMIYSMFKCEIDDHVVQWVSTVISIIISFPILIGDLVPFGYSTYTGYTKANFIHWFIEIFDEDHEIPKYYTSKFFFKEGNTIGILMFMVLPLLYYYFHKSKDKKTKIGYGILILVQSLSMMILGTRVATYGAVLVPVMYIIILLVMNIFKKEKFTIVPIIYSLVVTIIFALILPYSPAITNQNIDNKNNDLLLTNNMAQQGRDELAGIRVSEIKESDPFFINMFEEYGIKAHYANSISEEYYLYYYDYKLDPYFWTEMILNRPIEERVGGRNIQKLFFEYKWNDGKLTLKLDPNGDMSEENTQTIYFNGCNFSSPCLTQKNRLLGMGYSTFMNGGIVLERDFAQQYYTLGPIGDVLTCGIWIILTIVACILLVKDFKNQFNLLNGLYAISIVFGFASGYTSGHVLDQFITSLFMAMVFAALFKRLGKTHE